MLATSSPKNDMDKYTGFLYRDPFSWNWLFIPLCVMHIIPRWTVVQIISTRSGISGTFCYTIALTKQAPTFYIQLYCRNERNSIWNNQYRRYHSVMVLAIIICTKMRVALNISDTRLCFLNTKMDSQS